MNIKRMLDSYLKRHPLVVFLVECQMKMTKGCEQGSIGGPILWNLVPDPSEGFEERGNHCQALADVVVLIFYGYTALEVQKLANAALEYVLRWGIRNQLNFAPHTTYAMLITRKLKHDVSLLSKGGVDIDMSKEIKILGHTVNNKLTFNTHAANV